VNDREDDHGRGAVAELPLKNPTPTNAQFGNCIMMQLQRV
jgi:hypothetical protein